MASSSTAATYTADRFACNRGNGSTGVVTVSQSSDVPSGSGFPYSLLVTVTTTAASMNASEYNAVNQVIEGFNIADLAYGTASASPSVLSFWAKASVTGTYCGTLIQRGAATQRAYPFTYAVSSANTWVQYFITVSGDTSGTLSYNNAAAFEIDWYYGIGSNNTSGTVNSWNVNTSGNQYVSTSGVNMLATNGATLRITGVQLEKGSTATSFDYRPYGTELALCQRYLPAFTTDTANPSIVGSGGFSTSTRIAVQYTFPVTPRTSPTGITVSSAAHFNVSDNATGTACTAVTFNAGGLSCAQVYFDTATTYAAFRSGITYSSNASAKILFNGCEL